MSRVSKRCNREEQRNRGKINLRHESSLPASTFIVILDMSWGCWNRLTSIARHTSPACLDFTWTTKFRFSCDKGKDFIASSTQPSVPPFLGSSLFILLRLMTSAESNTLKGVVPGTSGYRSCSGKISRLG